MPHQESFTLAGLKLDKKTVNANGQSAVDCGQLWQQFVSEGIAGKISDKVNDTIYAVYFDYDGDRSNPYSFFIGCEVPADKEIPEGLDTLVIPAQDYAVITAKGKLPDCVADAWHDIWKSDINRAYGYDFEVYNNLSAWRDTGVDIHISLSKV